MTDNIFEEQEQSENSTFFTLQKGYYNLCFFAYFIEE